jgi:hypothetical protein
MKYHDYLVRVSRMQSGTKCHLKACEMSSFMNGYEFGKYVEKERMEKNSNTKNTATCRGTQKIRTQGTSIHPFCQRTIFYCQRLKK